MKVDTNIILHKEKYLHFIKSKYKDKDGKDRNYFWVKRPSKTFAVVIAAMHIDRLVLIKEFRPPVNDYIWACPAGLVEPGEDPEEAARREFKEETNLNIVKFIRESSPKIYTSPGISNEQIKIYFANVEGIPSIKNLEKNEYLTVHLLSKKEIKDILDSGDKISSRAYLIMLRFAETGKI